MTTISSVNTVAGVVTSVLKSVNPAAGAVSSVFSNSTSLANFLNNMQEGNGTVDTAFGIPINTSVLGYAASVNGALALWGAAATGVTVGGPVVLAVTLGLTAASLMGNENIRDALTDPNLWNGKIGEWLKDNYGIDPEDIERKITEELYKRSLDLGEKLGGIRDFTKNLNHNGTYRTAVRYRDPLTLDLDGDGIETLAENNLAGAVFDLNADGIRTASGWVKSDDGLLVLDRNGNGTIDDGSELFGDSTVLASGETATHGFAALADLDGNGDGKVDTNDARFTELKVWRDLNGDGVSTADELFTLDQVGIAALNTGFTNTSQTLAGNNVLAQSGSYLKTDGSTGQMGDVNLVNDSLYSQYTTSIALTDEQKKLPTLQGYGRLRELREAAALSPALAGLLTQYAAAQTRTEQQALLGKLVEEWAKTDPEWRDPSTFTKSGNVIKRQECIVRVLF